MQAARGGFESDFDRRGARLGECCRAGLWSLEIRALSQRRRGDVDARGKGRRRRNEQHGLRRELAQWAAVVAMAMAALRRGRGRVVVGLGAENGAVSKLRLQRRGDARQVRPRIGVMIG